MGRVQQSKRKQRNVLAPMVGVRWIEESERQRLATLRENRALGPVGGVRVRGRLTDVEKLARMLVERSQGELPPW